MAKQAQKLEADVVVVGSGPGGATTARELSRKGRKVVVLEKGPWVRKVGSLMVFSKAVEHFGQLKTIENDGSAIFQARCIGGGSLCFMGSAGPVDHKMWAKYGIDLSAEEKEAKLDCRVNAVPDALIAPGVKRLFDAAHESGYPWEKMEKFFNPDTCMTGCSRCMLGCPHKSKWTAVEFIEEAQQHGAQILDNVTARNLIIENGKAVGVMARSNTGQEYEVHGSMIVSAAGGISSSRLLQRAGMQEAGSYFVGDPTVAVMGFVEEGVGQAGEVGMAVGWHDEENGILYANAYSTRSVFSAMNLMAPNKLKGLRNVARWKRGMQIMCKITDDADGRIFLEEGKVSKKYTRRDLMRFDHAKAVAEKILVRAGCDPYQLQHSNPILGHPAGTVRMGMLLNADLQAPIDNLYCCDTGVFPEDLGRPPTLSLVALAKRLAKHLDARLAA